MKVMMINGSPHEHGCTRAALDEVARTLARHGIGAQIIWLGTEPTIGCRACGGCAKTGRCVFDDVVNEVIGQLDGIDGLIIGSPVHYAAASGQVTAFLDRLFYCAGRRLAGKPGAAVVSCRRGGASAAFDQLNKYFTICNMPIVPSQYWNQVHGSVAQDVAQDEEGLQTMRTLGENFAWLLACIEAGRAAGVPAPEYEPKRMTNFIR